MKETELVKKQQRRSREQWQRVMARFAESGLGIERYPAAKVEQLTPRLWKQHFGMTPLRSDISKSRAVQ